jgi:hypothetical protein
MMRAIILSVLLLLGGLSGARGEVIPGSQRSIQGWTLAAFGAKGRGFDHCAIGIAYRNGIILHFVMFANRNWGIGWTRDAWNFRVGQRVALQVDIDNASSNSLTAVARTPSHLLVELPTGSPLFDLVRRGNQMTVAAPGGGRIGFSLDGTSAALGALAACVDRYTQVAHAPSSPVVGPTAPRAPSPTRTTAPRTAPVPEPKVVVSLPLQNGNYVNTIARCDKASDDSLVRVSNAGIGSPQATSRFKQVVAIDWKTFRVTQDHVDPRTGANSTTTAVYELTSPSSYRIKDSHSANEWRFCAASSLPEPWRQNHEADRVVERMRESSMRLRPGVTRVDFAELRDAAGIISAFPFLTSQLDTGSTDTVLFAQVRDVDRHVDFLFLRQEGLINCGTAGCGTHVYADEGNGYKTAAALTVHQPIYIMKTESGASLIFCTQSPRNAFVRGAELKDYMEWPFRNHVFEVKGPITFSNPPACVP